MIEKRSALIILSILVLSACRELLPMPAFDSDDPDTDFKRDTGTHPSDTNTTVRPAQFDTVSESESESTMSIADSEPDSETDADDTSTTTEPAQFDTASESESESTMSIADSEPDSETDADDTSTTTEPAQFDTASEADSDSETLISEEEFLNTVIQEPTEDLFTGLYIVDGDIPLLDSSEVKNYYEKYANGVGGWGFDTIYDIEDKWPHPDKFHLTYCISKDFATNDQIVSETLAAASIAWSDIIAVRFEHKPDEDSNCTAQNDNVTFNVALIDTSRYDPHYNARAFFPHFERDKRTLMLHPDLFVEPVDKDNLERELVHQIGHILGFRHEQVRVSINEPECRDIESIMQSPLCQKSGSAVDVTKGDANHAITSYGLATHRLLPLLRYP